MPSYWEHYYEGEKSGIESFHFRYMDVNREDLGEYIAMHSGDAEVAFILYETPTGEIRQSLVFGVDEYEDWFEDAAAELEDKYGGGGMGSFGVGFISG